jgi:voltage-gated potassium channel
MKERPYIMICFTMVILIFTFGFAIRSAELPLMEMTDEDHNWKYLWNGMWNIIVTITMVGYGDFFPITHIGRVIGLIAAILGNLLIAVMVVSLTFTSEFSPQQRKAYELIN